MKTIGIENRATRENDEHLTPMMIGRSRPLQDGNGNVDNDLRNPTLREPNPHSQRISQIHAEIDYTMLPPTLRRKIKSLLCKMTFDD